MIPEALRDRLVQRIAHAEDSREAAIDVMFELQEHYGHMSDEAMLIASDLLGMTPLELDELATFYDFIYRRPVGRYVIHVCDSAVCWMNGHERVMDYIGKSLSVPLGGTTQDGLFTLLPVVCIGYCDRAPAMLINRKVYGRLTPSKIDNILQTLRDEALSEKSQ